MNAHTKKVVVLELSEDEALLLNSFLWHAVTDNFNAEETSRVSELARTLRDVLGDL